MCGAFALLHNSHVAIDIIYNFFSERIRRIIDLFCFLVLFFPFTLVALYAGYIYAARSWAQNEKVFSVCGSPLYIIKTVIPISFALIILQGFSIFLKKLLDIKEN
jgi:TRAP-type mannitol/chloroaromatic compound transport system permease small subunit